MSKAITARIYMGGKPISKVEYKTGENSKHGKKLARLVLDEFVGFTQNVAYDSNGKAESWAITYTDGDSELAFTSLANTLEVGVEIDGERVGAVDDAYRTERTEKMWEWLRKRGWY